LASIVQAARDAGLELDDFKVPRHLFIRDNFPKTPLGKVQKFLLKQQVMEGTP
jgi:acyl-coenzyme A synthetase/AMP-(fatty) acid ligase